MHCCKPRTSKNIVIWHLCAKLSFFHSFSKKKEKGSRVIKQFFNRMENVQFEYYLVLQINFRKSR